MTFQEQVKKLAMEKADNYAKTLSTTIVGRKHVMPITLESLQAIVFSSMVEGARLFAEKIREEKK